MSSPLQESLFDNEPVEPSPARPRRSNKLHAADHERRPLDFYETPPDLCDALVVGAQRLGLALPDRALDPCGGAGAIRRALTVHGINVALTDIAPSAYRDADGQLPDGYITQEPLDATKPGDLRRAVSLSGAMTIISNTPYGKLAQPIARNLVSLVESAELDMVALLYSALWAGAGERASLFDSVTYTGRIDALWRPIWIPGTNGNGTMPFSWHLWSRQPSARTVSITREQADEARRRANTTITNNHADTAPTTGSDIMRSTTAASTSEKGDDHECGK